MNTDFRISVSLPSHPKAIKLMRRCGDIAFYNLVKFWAYVSQNKPNGILTGLDTDDIEIASGWSGQCSEFYQALLDLRFIDDIDGVLHVHDWKEHNGYACHAEQRSLKAKRAAEARWNKESDATSIAQAMLNDAPSNAPSPAPDPITKVSVCKPTAPIPHKEIIEYLNTKANTKYRHTTKTTQRLIRARFNEGFGKQDFFTVIDKKAAEWKTDDKMVEYLRPQTLFGTKFESYLQKAKAATRQKEYVA